MQISQRRNTFINEVFCHIFMVMSITKISYINFYSFNSIVTSSNFRLCSSKYSLSLILVLKSQRPSITEESQLQFSINFAWASIKEVTDSRRQINKMLSVPNFVPCSCDFHFHTSVKRFVSSALQQVCVILKFQSFQQCAFTLGRARKLTAQQQVEE